MRHPALEFILIALALNILQAGAIAQDQQAGQAVPQPPAQSAPAAPTAADIAADAAVAGTGPATGLPLPRYVSLKSDKINLRAGPGTEYPISWVLKRAGMPVEVIKEFEGWRQVRDAEGVTGWVLQSFLSRRRTSLVAPWDLKPDSEPVQIAILSDDSENAAPVAILEAGVIADVHACDGSWCEVSVESYRGYIAQKKLWGVYEGEMVR